MQPTNTFTLVGIITIGIPIIVCLITAVFGIISLKNSNKNSKEIEKLKAQLKIKGDRDDYIFRLLMGYEDQNRTLYAQVSREYLIAVQQLKDEVRFLLYGNFQLFLEDYPKAIASMQDKVIKAFSNLYPTVLDKPEIKSMAHEIKRLYIEKVFNLLPPTDINTVELENTLSLIADLQARLAFLINEEFDASIRKLQQSNSHNDLFK